MTERAPPPGAADLTHHKPTEEPDTGQQLQQETGPGGRTGSGSVWSSSGSRGRTPALAPVELACS